MTLWWVRPELGVADIADLQRETVVIVAYDGHCMPEHCSLVRCPEGVRLSIESYCDSATDDVRVRSTILVLPKLTQDELTIDCYDGMRSSCAGEVVWGEPMQQGNRCY